MARFHASFASSETIGAIRSVTVLSTTAVERIPELRYRRFHPWDYSSYLDDSRFARLLGAGLLFEFASVGHWPLAGGELCCTIPCLVMRHPDRGTNSLDRAHTQCQRLLSLT